MAARKEVATCAISGAVGTFANIDPRVEAHVAAKMGLVPEPVSTQVIPRDRHAMFFATLGVVASCLERLAIEVRHLQRTEVLEAEEFFAEGPVWRGEGDFLTLLKSDSEVAMALTPIELDELFDLDYHLKHVDTIFARVFGEA